MSDTLRRPFLSIRYWFWDAALILLVVFLFEFLIMRLLARYVSGSSWGGTLDASILVLIALPFVIHILRHRLRLMEFERLRLEAREAIRTSVMNRHLALVAENTRNAVVIMDLTGKARWVNPAFLSMWGFTRDEILEHQPLDLLLSPQADPAAVEQIKSAFASRTSAHVEILYRAKNGESRWALNEIQHFPDAPGTAGGFISVMSDITENVHQREKIRIQ